MDGALAQLLALVAHGNEWLAHPEGPPPEMLSGNSTFQYVTKLEFQLKKRWGRGDSWAGTGAWLQGRRERGTRRLLLNTRTWRNPDLVNVAAADAPRGAIITLAGSDEVWTSRWRTMWDPSAEYPPDNRIWWVTYVGRSARLSKPPQPPTIDRAVDDLTKTLQAIRKFALEQDFEDWAAWFSEALDLVESEDAEIPYHPDVLPPGASSRQRRLAAAAFKAWVFGGMGSWIDKSVEGERAADTDRVLSRQLYNAILESLDAAAT